MSQLFAWGGQSIGVSASESFFPMHIQGWLPLGLTGLISLLSKRLSRVFSSTTIQKHQFFGTQFFMVQLSYPYMTTGKTIASTRRTFVVKVMSLLLSMLSRLVITFLPRSWLFASDGQSVGASGSVFPMNIQGWFPSGLTGLISLLSKGFSRVFSSTTIWKHQFFGAQPSSQSNSHIHTWSQEKP